MGAVNRRLCMGNLSLKFGPAEAGIYPLTYFGGMKRGGRRILSVQLGSI